MTSNKQKNINHSSHYDDYKKYSFMTIIAFAAFPTSFVLILPYADSLFIALTLATILLALKRKWGLAAVLASLTVITKPLGIIIMVFLIIEYLRSIKFNLKNINRNIAFSIFPIIALGVYLYWANYKFGNAIAFYNSQSNINRYFDPNLNFIWVWLRELFLLIELAFKQKYIETFLNEMGYFLSWTIAFYAVLRLMRLRVMSLSLSLYFIALLLAMIYGGNFVSVNRYVVIVIPLFWYLTLRLEHSSALKYFILILSLCFWVMNIVLFSNGFWVF